MRAFLEGFFYILLVLTICTIVVYSCSSRLESKIITEKEVKIEYLNNTDTIRVSCDSVQILKDSIAKLLKRPLMTSDQFIKIYKYDRLYKYYSICNRKPSQWKYYKGWSIRVFSE
jgi:hypothetical protein